jgi:asparagine synthase (glutamine-hydrolysing)
MCGIAGVLRLRDASRTADATLIHRMTDALAHRGPDDRGTWCDDRVMLGHRRLSVIDLSAAGHQPMGNEDGTVQIVYNGEMYNFQELKSRFGLAERGHVFRSRTDTEVLIHLYEEMGLEMAQHLNGMFALAIWDGRAKQLHLLRDPYGVKPLFVQQDGEHFRFGSEIKAILADARVPRRVNVQALHDYLTFDYVPGQQTAFEGIGEVAPGHWMTVNVDGRTSTGRYWDVSFDVDRTMTEAAASARALELMEQAVRRQLIADVPVGVMLSGGLDSSAIVALMHRHVTEPIRTYSVGFADESFNELPYARTVAKQFGTIQHEILITPERVREMLPRYLTFIDEPYADGSAIPTYYVCQLAKEDVVVVLSGEGGDEIFAGYDTYAAHKASQWFRRVPGVIRNGIIAPIVRRLPVSDKKLSLEFKMKRFLGGQELTPDQAHVWWRIVLTEAQKATLYSNRMRERLSTLEAPGRYFADWFDRRGPKDALARLMRIDSSVFLPDDLMIKNDRMSMAHSLEARVPFTDPDLTDFMSRVPAHLKLPGLRKKNVMRKALAQVLPPEILNKKKVGLEMPYSRWFKHELKDLMLGYLAPDRVAATGLFRGDGVRTLVQQHLDGKADHGRAIWGLLNYMMWLELYFPNGEVL